MCRWDRLLARQRSPRAESYSIHHNSNGCLALYNPRPLARRQAARPGEEFLTTILSHSAPFRTLGVRIRALNSWMGRTYLERG